MSKCKIIMRKGHRARNLVNVVKEDFPTIDKNICMLLNMRLKEAAKVGKGYMVVAEGESGGAVFMLEKHISKFLVSYGCELVPDIAMAKTISLLASSQIPSSRRSV